MVIFIGGLYWMMSNKTSNVVSPLGVGGPITSGENPQPGSKVHDLPVELAAAMARKDLATKLSIDEKSIVIMQIIETEWEDGCLGLGGPAESCMQSLVPGFKVEMLVKGKSYFYRTDKIGSIIRAEIQ